MEEYVRIKLIKLCLDALRADGHHKQAHLEEMLKLLEPTAKQIWNISWEEGIPG